MATSAASSMVTRCSVRLAGSIVVSRSCSAFISPRPLKRESLTPWRASSSTARRRSLEGVGPLLLVAEGDHERRLADQADQLRVRVDQLLVGGRLEQRLGQVVVAGQAAAAVGPLDASACPLPRREQLRLVGPVLRVLRLEQLGGGRPSSSRPRASRWESATKSIVSCPNSARRVDAQPSKALKCRLKSFQRRAESLCFLPVASITSNWSSLSAAAAPRARTRARRRSPCRPASPCRAAAWRCRRTPGRSGPSSAGRGR